DVLAGVALGLAHEDGETFIDERPGLRIADRSVVQRVRAQRAVFSAGARKNLLCDALGVGAGEPHDRDSAFARRRGDRGDGVFAVHGKTRNILSSRESKTTAERLYLCVL